MSEIKSISQDTELISNPEDAKDAVYTSLKDYCAKHNIIEVKDEVHISTENKYPFLVLLDTKNEATCLFFTRNETKRNTYSLGDQVTPSLLRSLNVVEYTHNGVFMTKITTGAGNRISLAGIF